MSENLSNASGSSRRPLKSSPVHRTREFTTNHRTRTKFPRRSQPGSATKERRLSRFGPFAGPKVADVDDELRPRFPPHGSESNFALPQWKLLGLLHLHAQKLQQEKHKRMEEMLVQIESVIQQQRELSGVSELRKTLAELTHQDVQLRNELDKVHSELLSYKKRIAHLDHSHRVTQEELVGAVEARDSFWQQREKLEEENKRLRETNSLLASQLRHLRAEHQLAVTRAEEASQATTRMLERMDNDQPIPTEQVTAPAAHGVGQAYMRWLFSNASPLVRAVLAAHRIPSPRSGTLVISFLSQYLW